MEERTNVSRTPSLRKWNDAYKNKKQSTGKSKIRPDSFISKSLVTRKMDETNRVYNPMQTIYYFP